MSLTVFAGAQTLSEKALIEQQKQKFRDFFEHRRKQQKFEATLQAGSEKYREMRKKQEQQAEQARLDFIKKRKRRPDFSSPELEEKWQQQQVKREAGYLEEERAFARVRQRVERIEARHYSISPSLELEIPADYAANRSQSERRKRKELESSGFSPSSGAGGSGNGGGNYRDYEPPTYSGDESNNFPAPEVNDGPPGGFPDAPTEPPPSDGGGDSVWDF